MNGTGIFLSSGGASVGVLIAGGAFIALLILGFFAARWIQRRYDPRRSSSEDFTAGLTIEQVEAMHRTGQISDEEFASMRRLVLPLESAAKKDSNNAGSDDNIKDSTVSETEPAAPDGQ